MARALVVAAGVCAGVCACAALTPSPAAGQAREADAIVERAIAWQGGRERLAKVRYVVVPKLAVTIHGETAGEGNEATLKALYFDRGGDGKPERIRFVLTTAAGTRTMGFDGERYWIHRRNFSAYLSRDRDDQKGDIEAVDSARDVLRYLLLPDLARDGEPFEKTGTIASGDTTLTILRKKDHKQRKVSLFVRPDGSVERVVRVDRLTRPADEDADGRPDPGGATEPFDLEVRVFPRDVVPVDGVKLPRLVEVQANGNPWVTARADGETPFLFPSPDDVDAKVFEKPK